MSNRMPTYFISHGGGPWPWIPNMRQAFVNLEASLSHIPAELPEPPKAVLMVSGHWETPGVEVMHAAFPPMVYDYYGFPPHTYDVEYNAPGAPELAEHTAELIKSATGLPTKLNETQGYDHGTFVPAYIMYPKANVPVYQVSIRKNYDPAEHFEIGRALAPLRDEGVLILGSGLSYHNLRNFGPGAKAPSAGFDAWLNEVLDYAPEERTKALLDWEKAPFARQAHAEEDHLVPLFTALGAAEGDKAVQTYHDVDLFGGVTASSWRFDA